MGLFSFFKNKKSFTQQLIDEYGFNDAVLVVAKIVMDRFNKDSDAIWGEMQQFIREEADAMRLAGGEPARFARKLFDGNESAYRGALTEDAEYPIDYTNGPQQVFNNIAMQLVQAGDGELAAKLKCAVVEKIAGWQEHISYMINYPAPVAERMVMEKFPGASEEVDKANRILVEIGERFKP